MVLPICQRVTYWRYAAPGTRAAVSAGLVRSATFAVTVSVRLDRLNWLERMSMPGTLVPPITGYSASPLGSLSPLDGEFDGPEMLEPNSPGPFVCCAIVITPAPAWSTSCAFAGVKPGCARPFEVSS